MYRLEELGEDINYEVISYLVMDQEYQIYSADHFFSLDSYNYIKHNQRHTGYLKDNLYAIFYAHERKPEILSIMETPFPKEKQEIILYRMMEPIHFDYAISLGFGVLRILTGPYMGQIFLFYSNSFVEDESDEEFNDLDEMLMLGAYIQLTNPSHVDFKELEILLQLDLEYVATLIHGDALRIINKLADIFSAKKGKVITFRNDKE